METPLKLLRRTRQAMLELLADLSKEQLVTIPKGFNNHLLWNLGHVVVTQQLLTYQLAGLAIQVNDDLLGLFRRGTDPQTWSRQVSKEELSDLSLSLIDKTLEDYQAGLLQAPHDRKTLFPYQTSFGGKLENITDAVAFNNVHEGLHFGTMKVYKRLLQL
jgi:hypothetical protein